MAQMYDHELNPVQGWPSQSALDKTLPIYSTNTWNAGAPLRIRCDSAVNSFTDNYDPDGDALVNGTVCPPVLFALQGTSDLDVNRDTGGLPGNKVSALCCLGAYELETTEFVAGTYIPGTLLSPNAVGTLQARADIQDMACGVISTQGPNSGGSYTNEFGVNVIRFWTCFVAPVTS